MIGGAGFDALYGGDGADTFAFSGRWGIDSIADFKVGTDRIVLVDTDPAKVGIVHIGNSTIITVGGREDHPRRRTHRQLRRYHVPVGH
ncbi:hypothetical protein ACFSTD_15225 [Novosphingobium colocasiae]